MKQIFLFLVSALLALPNYAQNKIEKNRSSLLNSIPAKRGIDQPSACAVRSDQKSYTPKYFRVTRDGFLNMNTLKPFIVVEVPGKDAVTLKNAAISASASLVKSPKDVVKELGEVVVSIDSYAKGVYTAVLGNDSYKHDVSYSMVIEFKDGKVKFNAPKIKQIYVDHNFGMLKKDMTKNVFDLIKGDKAKESVSRYFDTLIDNICAKIKAADDW